MKGDGTVYYDEARKKWCAQLYVDGRKRRRFAANKRDAGRLLAKLRQNAERAVSDALLTDYLAEWLEHKEGDGTRTNTLGGYRSRVAALQGGIGHIRLCDLTPRDVERYMASMKGRAPRTVAHHRAVLANALNDAIRWGLVPVNVAERAKPPKIERAERQVLTPADVRTLLQALEGDPLRPVYMLAATLGLRQGEILGLRWQDVDLKAGELRVRQTVRRVGGADVFERPKTTRSARALPLTPALVAALRDVRGRRGLVFQTEGGEALRPQTIIRHLHRVLLAAGLPRVTFHDLRHSAATVLAVQGVPPRVAAMILGHSNISTTMDIYTHVLDDQVRDAVRLVGEAYDPPTDPPTRGRAA